ncbi:MAG: flagellar hook-associated protein FlgL [Noviherbaspirillum sp.]
MRISTSNLFESNIRTINDTQSSLAKTQQQMATGRRLLTPADDPLGAAKALDLSQGQSMNTQYAQNRSSAKNALNMQEGALQSVTGLLQDVRAQVLAAGSGILDDTSRKFIATDLRSRLEELSSLANSRDGVGNYIFAGVQDGAPPFSGSGGAVSYVGDNGQKLLQVGASRQMASNDSGEAVFMNIAASSVYSGSSSGTGTARLSSVMVSDSAKVLPGHQYEVSFDATGANYSVYDLTKDPFRSTALAYGPYVSQQPITVDGLEMVISGAPQAGDAVGIKPVRSQSMFATMEDLIATLETPVSTADERRMLTFKLGAAGANIDNALNNVLSTRASVGSRLQELDSLDESGSTRDQQYADQLSGIQDLDYVKAISDLTQKQMMLQAAQQSAVKVWGLSLFNFI